LIDRFSAKRSIEGSVKRLIGGHKVNQVVPDPFSVIERRLGCPDIHILIDLHRVSADDFTPQRFRPFNSQFGFSYSCRTEENHDPGPVILKLSNHMEWILMNS
jgi:hypothetical protein